MAKKIYTLGQGSSFLDSALHKKVLQLAKDCAVKLYLTGGALRDLLVNELRTERTFTIKDLDYVVASGGALDFARRVADSVEGHFVPLDQENDTARVVLGDGYILDFAGLTGNSIEEDMQRRDFTVNACYLDPDLGNQIVDCVGALDDIKYRVIRALSEDVLVSDPLRLLRAFRFAALLQFKIEDRTIGWIKSHAEKINAAAGERISNEIFLAFKEDFGNLLLQMAESNLLENIFPELKATRQVTNNAYHHLNLFDHSIEAVLQVEKEYLQNNNIWASTNLLDSLGVNTNISHIAVCKIATLLHDIGKPATWVITEEGKHTFIGHERVGASMVGNIARQLRWSNGIEDLVRMLIELHLRPGQLFHTTEATQKGINRLYRAAGEDFPALILLALGDLGATKGPQMTAEKSADLRDKFYRLLSGFEQYFSETKNMKKILDGHEIMEIFQLPPGKELGEILGALQEAQELKSVCSREEAIDFIRTFQAEKK